MNNIFLIRPETVIEIIISQFRSVKIALWETSAALEQHATDTAVWESLKNFMRLLSIIVWFKWQAMRWPEQTKISFRLDITEVPKVGTRSNTFRNNRAILRRNKIDCCCRRQLIQKLHDYQQFPYSTVCALLYQEKPKTSSACNILIPLSTISFIPVVRTFNIGPSNGLMHSFTLKVSEALKILRLRSNSWRQIRYGTRVFSYPEILQGAIETFF